MYDVVVIGSGPGGYVAAIRCAQLGLKTACIEKGALGGTCLNVGCIPSKCLLHDTEVMKSTFGEMMARKRGVISDFNAGIGGLFKKNKIDHIQGFGRLTSPTTIDVEGKSIEAKNIILATGSEPTPLPGMPFDEKKILSSTGVLALNEVPKKLVVVGAGVIGVELGSVYARLGCEVVFYEMLDRICPTFDRDISKELQKILTKQGMTFHLGSKFEGESETILVCVGRRPYTEGLGLEEVGVDLKINGSFQTNIPNIYAIGDIVDGPMLAHKASEEGVAVAEIIAGHTASIDYMCIPSVVYTHPEVASAGLTEEQCKEFNVPIKIGKFPFMANSRARCTDEVDGFVKLIACAKTDRLLGAAIIGGNASELIAPCVIALEKRMSADELANLCFAHPTLSEAIKEAALAVNKKAIHI